MPDDALMELVEDIWSDGSENIDIWQVLPERMVNRLDTHLMTCTRKGRCRSIDFIESVENIVEVPEWTRKVHRVTNLIA